MNTIRRWLHRRCREQAQHAHTRWAAECYRLDEALAESAEAHQEAEDLIGELESDLAGERDRAEEAVAAVQELRYLLNADLDLEHIRLEHQDGPTAQVLNLKLAQILLRMEADGSEPGFYCDHVHRLADAYQDRVLQACRFLQTRRVLAPEEAVT